MILDKPPLDEADLQRRRLGHLRSAMVDADLDLLVITNPVNIRYATGYRGYAAFQSRIPSAYLLVPADGPVVLHGAYTDALDTIDACRPAHSITTFDAGPDQRRQAGRFIGDLQAIMRGCGMARDAVVGVERTTPLAYDALRAEGLEVRDAEPCIELARSDKIDGEMIALRHAIATAEMAMTKMYEAVQPGRAENEIWSILHAVNVANDGDWIDGRMLCSGPRTNPWYNEASDRTIEAGDLVAFDTDMIGPYGYCADVSRTWVCGESASTEQHDLYQRAHDEIEHNTALLKPGASFAELSQSSFRQPEEFIANRYACVFHGVGMSDEYPKIPYPQDWEWTGYDGEVTEGMVLSVESYVGATGGSAGVKIEQMVQVTANGTELLSTSPLGLI